LKRKISVVTGGRAEYGLMKKLMGLINEDENLILSTIVTGSHLSKDFGFTFQEIERDGFTINREIEILDTSDTKTDTARAMSKALLGISEALAAEEPDILVLVGDRYEIFAAAIAAHILKLPIAHVHGGEITAGAQDDAFRHSITKLSQLHFVAAEEYRRRVIQLGESNDRIFMVGGLGVDSIEDIGIIPREELENLLGAQFRSRNLLVTFHPSTLEKEDPGNQFEILLKCLTKLNDTTLVFTLPNADSGSLKLISMVKDFVAEKPNAYWFESLGQSIYYSCLAHFDGVVGNSSSGLLEMPSFKKATINIGNRQKGRLRSTSVIDVSCVEEEITEALFRIESSEFKTILEKSINPYGSGGASSAILDVLKNVKLDRLMEKNFVDLDLFEKGIT
jgi:GDP/UDP-N,N'-diacetylbacillosamine 2-epimerase (hydrolysing)